MKWEREKELIAKAKKGDERSFEMLMQENYQRIYNLAFRLLRNAEDAYELTSDTFIRAYRSLGKFRGESSFYTYLYRICLNLGMNFLKRRKGRDVLESETLTESFLSVSGPVEEYRRKELREVLENSLMRLSPQERTVFILRQYEGLTIKEIGASLGLKEGTVKATYFHAVSKLRDFLKKWL